MNRADARRYAQGLLGAVPDGTDLEALAAEVREAVKAMRAAPELMAVLDNPRVAVAAMGRLVETALEAAGASSLVSRFLGLVASRGHAGAPDLVVEAVEREVDSVRGVLPAEIRSARPLEDAEIERIKGALERAMGKPLRTRVEVDPDLIAGVVARAGDVIFDGSARRQLSLMRDKLVRTGI